MAGVLRTGIRLKAEVPPRPGAKSQGRGIFPKEIKGVKWGGEESNDERFIVSYKLAK
jgi:hypothetical protein